MRKLEQPHADPLLIAGGGIGGLTSALSLAEAGFHIHVFEQAGQLTEAGAGLQLWPNATRVLRDLNLLQDLEHKAMRPGSLRVYNARRGMLLAEMPLGSTAEQRWGAPILAMQRSDLQQALLNACAQNENIQLHLGCRSVGFDARQGVQFRYQQDGEEKIQKGCALIGADGVHSRLRELLLHDGSALTSGYVAYRAQFPAGILQGNMEKNSTILWLAPDLHIVHYRLCDDVINLVAVMRDAAPHTGHEIVSAEPVLRLAHSCCAELNSILRLPQSWTRWPLFCRRPDTGGWPHCVVTLVGDAAHPVLPFLAQGAAQAIEDAAVLAHCLTEEPQYPADAFQTYRNQRAGRTAKVQRTSAQNGKVFHNSGLFALARDAVLKLMSGERLMARYDWLYHV